MYSRDLAKTWRPVWPPPIHQEIASIATNNSEQIEILGDTLTTQILQFFEEHSAFFLDEAAKVPGKTYISHNNSTITQLEDLKKSLRAEAFGPEGSEDKRKQFYQCLQAISELKQKEKRKQELKTTSFHEKQFHKNRYSKQISDDTFGKTNEEPFYDKQAADHFYTSTYSNHRDIDFSQLHWFPNLPTSPDSTNFTPFNLEPIRPCLGTLLLFSANLTRSQYLGHVA